MKARPPAADNAAESEPLRGRVLASHGRHALVAAEDGERVLCTKRGRRLEIVCGDEVLWRRDVDPGRGIILERLPRRSALVRTNASGVAETLVANVTQLVVLVAPEPEPDFFIVDRYLAAAELLGLRAAVVRNKSDLEDPSGEIAKELANYARIGYRVAECSARTPDGVAALEPLLAGETSVLVGQSGVGKSSLANRLLPGLAAATAELSRATAEGRHVTSVATLHALPHGGELIDSPGVRDFAPAVELLGDAAAGFREIAAAAPGCRFADCRHLKEPDCAVRAAVEAATILPRRYESYRRLRRLGEDLAPDPGKRREKARERRSGR
jgi:ribosome biogenesis GTPase